MLDAIQGVKIQFTSIPPIRRRRRCPCSLPPEQVSVLQEEIKSVLTKGAIKETSSQGGFLSNIHVVPKKDGGWRPIVDLRALNQCVVIQHFKMEGLHMLKEVLSKRDRMDKVDLKDAYLTVPIHVAHMKYLKFQWEEKTYEFLTLPFGLASAPRTFTKIMRLVVSHLRAQGIRLLSYIDNMLVIAES